MSDHPADKTVLGSKALEIVMRDVLYGMEDLASAMGYRFNDEHFKIISIERVGTPGERKPAPAGRSADIISIADRLGRDKNCA